MVFCAYCGKSFTRKEHLERHIPSHTNVKPHRCSACQLSFARRDLLQRHHSTYHEARDPMEPLPGGVPTVAGRTPIACQNCANAKTGCDKRVPCSRCAEKNLPCAARFARRSSKAAVRAAQASAAAAAAAAAFTAQMVTSPTQPGGPQPLTPATFIDLEQQQQHHASVMVAGNGGMKLDSPPLRSPLGLEQMVVGGTTGLEMCLSDPSTGLAASHLHHHHQQQQHHLHQHPHLQHAQHQDTAHSFNQQKKPAQHVHTHLSPDDFSSPHAVRGVDGLDEFMGFGGGNEFIGQDNSYQDLIWADYPMDIDMYASPLQLGRQSDMAAAAAAGLIPPFAAVTELSDISSSSEPMTVSSSQGSVHTRGTSILSSTGSGEYEGRKNSSASTGHGTGGMGDIGGVPSNVHGSGNSLFRQQQQQHIQQQASMFDMAAMAPCSEGGIPEFEVVVASEAAWPLARCTPPIYSGACPRTAIVHLECLEQKSKQEGTWTALEQFLDNHQPDATDVPQVVPLTSRSRDKILAITQSFLHKALDIHRSGMYPKNGAASPGAADFNFNFVVLPPSRILEYFLKSYVHSLAIYYPLIVGGVVDPNEMLDNNQASTLLVLLMIAQGAATVPMAEARYLSAGLSETCRISLFDIIEKNVELSADPTALRCALLFTLLGAWSGDKWQMDISMGQRSMYLSMLKHAGMLELQPSMVPSLGSPMSTELQWRSWLHRESQNRLVYNWVMVDQELSLFHDTAPVLSISDLQCPLPSSEALWLAPTADRWASIAQSTYSTGTTSNNSASTSPLTPSLCELFQDFLHDNLARRKVSLSPQQLRLLLHPLQGLLCHLRQMLSCLPEVPPVRRTTNRTVTKASTMQRLEEVQAQLQHWYELSMACYKANPGCAVTRCNLVLYHLISLNAVTNFPEIERLARRDGLSATADPSVRHKRCIFLREEAVFHCGQVLRILRQMPADRRPSWWSAALYRAVLILWADSACHVDSKARQQPANAVLIVHASATTTVGGASPTTVGSPIKGSPAAISPGLSPRSHSSHTSMNGAGDTTAAGSVNAASLVAIDSVTPEDQAVIAYLWGGDGVTAVLTHSDGSHFTLDTPSEILAYGVKRIDEAVSTRISDGIRRKLLSLASNWSDDALL